MREMLWGLDGRGTCRQWEETKPHSALSASWVTMKINDLLLKIRCGRVDRCLPGSDCGYEWIRLMMRHGEEGEQANGR